MAGFERFTIRIAPLVCPDRNHKGNVMQITANGIALEAEEYGPADGIPLILIRGLGSQLIHWPAELYQGLAAKVGNNSV